MFYGQTSLFPVFVFILPLFLICFPPLICHHSYQLCLPPLPHYVLVFKPTVLFRSLASIIFFVYAKPPVSAGPVQSPVSFVAAGSAQSPVYFVADSPALPSSLFSSAISLQLLPFVSTESLQLLSSAYSGPVHLSAPPWAS